MYMQVPVHRVRGGRVEGWVDLLLHGFQRDDHEGIGQPSRDGSVGQPARGHPASEARVYPSGRSSGQPYCRVCILLYMRAADLPATDPLQFRSCVGVYIEPQIDSMREKGPCAQKLQHRDSKRRCEAMPFRAVGRSPTFFPSGYEYGM